MQSKTKKIRYIFFIYWFLLAYIVAALVWWFIELNRQNEQMTIFELQQLQPGQQQYYQQVKDIQQIQKRKTAQYIGEGVTFFILIAAGAAFVFRAVRKQLKISQQQQNFMMALTHELKTPIAVTKLNLETLQKRKLEESQQQRIIQNTIQEANRLNSLCNNMLLSSQIEANNFLISNEDINLSELTIGCVQDFVTRYPQRIIQTTIQEQVYTDGDQLLLQMAVNNLIENAIKYSPKESIITVVLAEDKNAITLHVKDEGKGIADEEKKNVFVKFYRIGNAATKAAKGTGLGLFLTKRILQQHNGNISVTDNYPTGSIFTITLNSSAQKN
ncbi:sensor histidine kinase [Ferruginibacter sp.]|nr:HAMP domain-containing histidine kinase [Ferruginibacter sp.]